MKKKRSFSLIELIVVLIIIGVFATIAIISYSSYRERVLDKEAIVALKLLQQAQKLYRMENTAYYPTKGSKATDIAAINSNLKIFLDEQNWDYTTYSKGTLGAGTSTAERSGRTWTLTIDVKDPVCTGSCP